MSLDTTAPSYAAGQILTAAQLNALQDGIQAPWSAYTPTWTAVTTNPTLGNGTIVGRYLQIGKSIYFSIQLTYGSTTTGGTGGWIFSLPVNSRGAANTPFNANARLIGQNVRFGVLTSATTFSLYDPAGTVVTSTVPVGWASGNVLSIEGFYEAA